MVRVDHFWINSYIDYKSNVDRNKALSVEEYLNKIEPYLIKDFINNINNIKKFETWKIELTITVNFISSKDNDEAHVIYSKSDNIDIMINP